MRNLHSGMAPIEYHLICIRGSDWLALRPLYVSPPLIGCLRHRLTPPREGPLLSVRSVWFEQTRLEITV